MTKLIAFLTLFCFLCIKLPAESPRTWEVFLQRHSGKSYQPHTAVSVEQMRVLMEAARWAPSSHNDQPWYFIICDRYLTPEAYLKAFESLKTTQQAWVQNAPLLIVMVARRREIHNGKINYWCEYDCGAAAMSLALQATALGLMVHQIGGFDKEKIIENFVIPDDHKPMTIMVVGYEEAQNPDPSTPLRVRRSLEETFFLGSWGSPFPPP